MQENCCWHTLETTDAVAFAVCQRILNAAERAIAERGAFKLVLAGGSTPEKVYRLLSAAQANWPHWFIYYGDERCLPANHPERNSQMATQAFLAQVNIPEAQLFTIPTELGSEAGAAYYQTIVAKAVPFDMVLLGMGEDGHTASLFPGHQHKTDDWAHAVYNSPKPPPERVSISAKGLSQTHELIFLITGSSKQEAIKQWRAGDNLPVATIKPACTVDIYTDKAAEPN